MSDELLSMAGHIEKELKARIAKVAAYKPSKPRPVLSLSSAGKCQRQAMYKILKAKENPWSWRQKITLEDGDFGHDQLRKYLRKTFRTKSHIKLVSEEKTVYLNVHGRKIAGHVDGIITKICDCPAHKDWPRDTLLEVKTCSPGSYNYMKRGDVSPDYRAQATAYMAALGIEDCLFMFKNKGTGEFVFISYKKEQDLEREIFERYERILKFKRGGSTDLEREYGPDERGRLPFSCNFCPFVLKCWREYKPSKLGTSYVYQLSTDMLEVPGINDVIPNEEESNG
tara:strand:- start:439 stop:1287 length:849 start_codon:yes stop_codon:yes gene_type:complete